MPCDPGALEADAALFTRLLRERHVGVSLPTKSNDFGFPAGSVGFPVDVPRDPTTPVEDVARDFGSFV